MVEDIAISKLTFLPNNPRTISDKRLDQLKRDIADDPEFLQARPVLVNKVGDTLTIYAGNMRTKAAIELGWEKIPVRIDENLPTEVMRKRALRDNQEYGEWDHDVLEEYWAEELSNLDLPELEPIRIEPEIKEDDFDPDSVEKNIHNVVRGDIWQLGDHRLMCGDATMIDDVEKLMGGQKADMVFTDPPYGYSYESNHQSTHKELLNDDRFLDFLGNSYTVSQENSAHYVCCGWQTSDQWRGMIRNSGLNIKNMIIWRKNNWSMGDLKGAYAGQHEIIWFAHKGRATLDNGRDRDVWDFDRIPPTQHPTMKPVSLIVRAINNHMSNTVLDLFGGSGSTLIACEQTNRKCYMMELDEHYVSVIIERWEKLTNKKALRLNN